MPVGCITWNGNKDNVRSRNPREAIFCNFNILLILKCYPLILQCSTIQGSNFTFNLKIVNFKTVPKLNETVPNLLLVPASNIQ